MGRHHHARECHLYLKDASRTWFETHESELILWDLCRAKLIEIIGRKVRRQHLETKAWLSRLQSETDTNMTYAQDVLSLWQMVDDNMSDSTRVATSSKEVLMTHFNFWGRCQTPR